MGMDKVRGIGGMGRVLGWANAKSPYTEPLGKEGPVPAETNMTNINVMALLIARNGFSPKITGWGQFQGPFGLTQKDALLMMELTSYFQGLIDGAGLDSVATLGAMLEPELFRLQQEFAEIDKGVVTAE